MLDMFTSQYLTVFPRHLPSSNMQHPSLLNMIPVYGPPQMSMLTLLLPSIELTLTVSNMSQTCFFSMFIPPYLQTSMKSPILRQNQPSTILAYLATHLKSIFCYYTRDMILCIVADTFSVMSRIPILPQPNPNHCIHILCQTLYAVQGSSTEAETCGLFLNGEEKIPILTTLV